MQPPVSRQARERIDRVRVAYEAFDDALRRGEVLPAIAEFSDPEIEWHPAAEDPDAHPHYGHDGVKRFIEQWTESFDELTIEPEEILDAGEKVVVLNHYRGRGRASGVEMEGRVYQVLTLRDEKVVRVDEFYERADALAAAGLFQ